MPVAVPPQSPFGPTVFPPTQIKSVWQRTALDDPLVNAGRDEALPARVDMVIIGSGLSGAVTAYSLLSSPSRPASVVVLEARSICSGASGRNGGHCRPDAFCGFNAFAELHGSEQAKLILESEAITLARVAKFIEDHQVECEFTPRPTLYVCLTQEFTDYIGQAYADSKAAGIDVGSAHVHHGAEAARVTRSPECATAYQWPAATVNPLKLDYAVHRAALSLGGYSMFSHRPVTAVEKVDDAAHPLKKVVYATNGYSKLLLPEFASAITPFTAQGVLLTPPPDVPEAYPRLEPSISLRLGLHNFNSVASRPDNTIVLASPRSWPGQTQEEYNSLYGGMDDSGTSAVRVKVAFANLCKALPGGGYDGSSGEVGQSGLESHWHGIIGMGQFIIAGFNGHGMGRIFHCAPCLADVVLGGIDAWDPTVSTAFQATAARLGRLAKAAGSLATE
ncbi:hypothetical protein Q5752_004069 [Cryptotrichosporon argae]